MYFKELIRSPLFCSVSGIAMKLKLCVVYADIYRSDNRDFTTVKRYKVQKDSSWIDVVLLPAGISLRITCVTRCVCASYRNRHHEKGHLCKYNVTLYWDVYINIQTHIFAQLQTSSWNKCSSMYGPAEVGTCFIFLSFFAKALVIAPIEMSPAAPPVSIALPASSQSLQGPSIASVARDM